MAESLEFHPDRLQSIGNWQDIPGSKAKDKPRATQPMHRRYAQGILGMSAESKGMILVALHAMRGKLEMAGDVVVADTERALQTLRAATLREDELRQEWQSGVWEKGATIESPVKPHRVQGEPSPEQSGEGPRGMSPTADEESSDSSVECSEVDHESSEPDNGLEHAALEWFVQEPHGRKPFLHIAEDFPSGCFPQPYCRDTPFQAWPREMGVGLDEAIRTGVQVCPMCVNRLPNAAAVWRLIED